MEKKELLDKAIEACENLLNLMYEIEIAKKSKIILIRLMFLKADFSHILGLHKLTDINTFAFVKSKRRRYEIVKNNTQNLRTKIVNSNNFNKIESRLNALVHLEEILDSNNELYYERPDYLGDSQINYDILIKHGNYKFVFAFLVDSTNKNQNRYVIESLFEDYNDFYTNGRRPYSIICKNKINRKTNRITNLYRLK